MNEKQAMKWEKTRSRGKVKFYLNSIVSIVVTGIVLITLLNWVLNHSFPDMFFLIFVSTTMGIMFSVNNWGRMEKEYLKFLQEKS
jgi:hypothetical protein